MMAKQKRKPGRPSKGPWRGVYVKLDPELVDAAKERAESEGTTLTGLITRLLARAVRRR